MRNQFDTYRPTSVDIRRIKRESITKQRPALCVLEPVPSRKA